MRARGGVRRSTRRRRGTAEYRVERYGVLPSLPSERAKLLKFNKGERETRGQRRGERGVRKRALLEPLQLQSTRIALYSNANEGGGTQ